MTIDSHDVLVEQLPPEPSSPPRPPLGRGSLLFALASNLLVQACLVAGGAMLLRLVGIRRSFDLFIDEVTYTSIANNLARGRGLTLDGVPFDLHPPAMLAVLALVIRVFGLHGSLEHLVLDLRPVAAAFGALSCAGAFVLTDRVAGRRWAFVVAGLVALNPLVIFYDSQVMLEGMSQAAAVAMVVALVGGVRSTTKAAAYRWAVGAGFFGAVVVCTKETFGLVAVALLLIVLVTGWVLPRRQVALSVILTFAGFATWVVCIGLATGFGTWWDAQRSGILRLVGAVQSTGFNAPTTHVSLVSRAFANGATDGVTYVLLVFGALSSLALLWRLRPWRHDWAHDATPKAKSAALIAIWAICASAYLSYAICFGSLEEQMFYIMVLPTTASLCVWASLAAPSWRKNWRKVGVVLLLGVLVAEGAVWGVVHTRTDDTYQQFLAWEPSHVPAGSTISVTEGTAQFLVLGAVLGDWSTVAELRAHNVDYVLLSTTLVEQGYGSARSSFEAILNRRAKIVFEADGTSTGSLRLYSVRQLVRETK